MTRSEAAATPTTTSDPTAPIAFTTAEVLSAHLGGKLLTTPRIALRDRRDLSIAYSPGVAQVCQMIAQDPELADTYTTRASTVAVISDGTAVLGLGDIGPRAAMPVMEGKSLLFHHFAGLNSIPICLQTTDVEEIVTICAALAPTFGGINLEDIAAPRCFEIEQALQDRVDIPVFHDDQHGTAIVTLAALINSAKVLGAQLTGWRVVISGAGAAGVAIASILRAAGVYDVIITDSRGVIGPDRPNLPEYKQDLLAVTNPSDVCGKLADALDGADVFIGVSGARVSAEEVELMAPDRVVLALANPNPEVKPEVGQRIATIYGTGRSDLPNQVNNVLAFPGVFRGAFDARATRVTERMKMAAAQAIADVVAEPTAEHIVPGVFNEDVCPRVSEAVAVAAHADGVVRP